ncbi:hypothetical protein V6N13_131187 [Hibiscus sabdariffa]|uniref:Prohibitin n=1 Tax=Hibiscus sabdariffa TaxID=183260 RepID=A0ABR2D737_9ROSI
MEVNRGQNGIQQLLAAEQEAQHIVNAARNGKLNFEVIDKITVPRAGHLQLFNAQMRIETRVVCSPSITEIQDLLEILRPISRSTSSLLTRHH